MPFLAHSARPKDGIPAQEYGDHVARVRGGAVENALAALRYRSDDAKWIASAADWAACYHDLGKLHDGNQRTLASGQRTASLEVNHVDAGTAHLIAQQLREPAIAVYGHHIGLVDCEDERRKQHTGGSPFRDERIAAQVDAELPNLLKRHHSAAGPGPAGFEKAADVSGLDRRILISCLVDADHSDTARHYDESIDAVPPAPRWRERLAALDAYVAGLPADGERSEYRKALYGACRGGDRASAFVACDSPVGSGKTTAVMAYLLQVAEQFDLRHIFVVLPYTNIIRQAVKVYRKALCLPGEDAEAAVAAHHHLAEFTKMESRHLTTLWQAPVIVTTAVQFFETLGAAATGRLRKLHQLPGSAVLVDEAHAAMPVQLWPYMWNQLNELAERWSCRFVFGSGSLARFWESPRLSQHLSGRRRVPVIAPAFIRDQGAEAELKRVEYRTRAPALGLADLTKWIEAEAGPRVAVMNTVQSAAVVARELRERGGDVLHLSTALSPADRERVVQRVEKKLASERNGSWTLVATSCVEAGLDFDFATGFRERARAASLVQLGGRVNRHGDRSRGMVWDFVTDDPQLSQHPEFEATRRVVRQLFEECLWNRTGAGELMTLALERELIQDSAERRIEDLRTAQQTASYLKVAELTRLIATDTRLVVVDPELVGTLGQRAKAGWKKLLAGSVQLWSSRIMKLKLEPVPGFADVYMWGYEYEPEFLGIMAGVLRQMKGDQDGYFFV